MLGGPTRVRILGAPRARAVRAGHQGSATESAVSHQLRLLRGARLVRARRDGRLVFYALDDHHIVKLFEQGLKHVQEQK